MAFAIPKIEWLGATVLGNTANNNAVVSGIASTAGLTSGMLIRGAGIPFNTRLLSVGVSTVTMNKNATATASGVSLTIRNAILFDYPPIEKKGKRLDAKERAANSISGKRQVSIDYVEELRDFDFSFLSQARFNEVDSFMRTHAIFGREFDYFEDQTLTSFLTYELAALKLEPTKIAPKNATDYVWSVPLQFRREL